jgi:hypothetical protein
MLNIDKATMDRLSINSSDLMIADTGKDVLFSFRKQEDLECFMKYLQFLGLGK